MMRPSLKPRNLAISTGDFFEQIKGVEIWKGEREREIESRNVTSGRVTSRRREKREKDQGEKSHD